MTRSLSIEYTDDILASIGLSEREFAATAKFLIAAQLYADGKLSAGQGASLCGLGKVEFLHELARRGIPASNLRVDDADTELGFARGQ
jgi:predicted HTH domain antitoxin